MSRWPTVPLGNLLKPADEPVSVQRDQKYPNFGIYSFGRGLFKKPPIDGMATSASALLRVRAGNFIYSRLFAFEGSYGLVDEAFDDHYVSNEYPSFEIDRNRLEPGFLKAYFQLPTVWQSIAKGSKGVGSRRIRVHPDQVLMHKMALPPLTEQQAIVTRLDTLADKVRQVAENLDAIEADAERLLGVGEDSIFAKGGKEEAGTLSKEPHSSHCGMMASTLAPRSSASRPMLPPNSMSSAVMRLRSLSSATPRSATRLAM